MADKQTSGLTAAAALDGTELVHVVQSANSRKATAANVALSASATTAQVQAGTASKNVTCRQASRFSHPADAYGRGNDQLGHEPRLQR
jgi:hypothetical protein